MDRQIGLGIGFEGLRNKSQSWAEDKEWYDSREEDKKSEIARQPPKIIEAPNKSAISIEADLDRDNLGLVQGEVEHVIRIGGGIKTKVRRRQKLTKRRFRIQEGPIPHLVKRRKFPR